MRLLPGLLLLCAAALPGAAHAQSAAQQFHVSPKAGFIRFDEASSLENAGALTVDAMYSLTSMFSLGIGLTVARPSTRGEDFVAALTFGDPTKGDTTFYFNVEQPVSILDASLNGKVGLPLTVSRISPFLTGGVGYYTLYLDPQVVGGDRRFGRMSMNFGGGLDLRLAENSGIVLEVRDLIFTKYQRERLRPSDARFAVIQFPEDFPTPPDTKETVHNIVFNIGFSFTPMGRGTSAGATEEERQ
jgi:hypothetical protein